MHPEDIKAGLRKKGSSLAVIARELGVTYSALSRVLSVSRSRRIEERIAEVLDLPLSRVWPDRYAETTRT